MHIQHLTKEIDTIPNYQLYGRITSITGSRIEVSGLPPNFSIGNQCMIIDPNNPDPIACEIIGFQNNVAIALPFYTIDGVSPGAKVVLSSNLRSVFPSENWLGRIINGLGQPIDEKGPLIKGDYPIALKNTPPKLHNRKSLGDTIDLGVKSINTFLTCRYGQRMGIFSGSGVGKSTLLSMFAKAAKADVNVIGLIGERGREAQEFIEKELGEEGLKKSILIVSTSDESALLRRQASYMTLAISEYFRSQGKEVLCMIDSLTRFAMAQREIGLSAGEPPTTKGYPPSVFSELPKLLERAGPGQHDEGDITGLFTILVEGDDHDEPIADTVRGIIDGHIVLDRQIAERGRFPSVNILKSISRVIPDCHTDIQNETVTLAKKHLANYENMAELIRIGAYKKGENPEIDEAIQYYPQIEAFLTQNKNDYATLEDSFNELRAIFFHENEEEINNQHD